MDSYRYGFQNQEKDDELKGAGNSVNYKYRMHDPRVGRFFAIDPLEQNYPFYSPYQFSGNQVIHMVELEGKEPVPYSKCDCSGHREGLKVSRSDGYRGYLFYHNGGKFTQGGWYVEKDYNWITKPITQDEGPASRMFSSQYPVEAWKIGNPDWDNDGDISSTSGAFSTNAKLGENVDGNNRNAFRHGLWQATITYEINYLIAAKAGYMHEQHPNVDLLLQGEKIDDLSFEKIFEADEFVDLINNRRGRNLGQSWKNQGLVLNRKEMAIKTLEYFRDEGFYVTTQLENGDVRVSLHKLTMKEFKAAYQNLLKTDNNGFNKADGNLYNPNGN